MTKIIRLSSFVFRLLEKMKEQMQIIYRLRLLGTIQVEMDGALLRNFESRKALALLGYLARQDQPVSRSHLADLFWGDKEEARGRRNLSRELSQLSALLPGCFRADYYTIQFQPPDTYWVDTVVFEELVKSSRGLPARSARRGEQGSRDDFSVAPQLLRSPTTLLSIPATPTAPDLQADKLTEAVALYRGDFMTGYFLDDCPDFETWLVREQENWRRQVTELLERLIVYHARSDQDDPALAYARRWLELEPWRERAHRYLMLLLARNGERTGALAQYEICRHVLAEELAVEPSSETIALYERIRAGELDRGAEDCQRGAPGGGSRGDFAAAPERSLPQGLLPRAPAVLHNLPPHPTPLIGREEELAQITKHLADPAHRLLTLVGPGGIGKTRLAIQAAWQAVNLSRSQSEDDEKGFPHGVYYIDLDALSSAEFLVSTIAAALNFSFYSGADPASQLLNYLHEKRVLLVLDNLEQLLAPPPEGGKKGGADLITDLLKGAPQVKILAVSRERLNLREEWLFPIQGLRTPPPSLPLIGEGLENYSAVQLFLQRAQAGQPGFSLSSEEEKTYAVRICQLAEGIPLAIELAAAWTRLLSCREIAQEIENNLDFLATSLRNVPERHRSLRAVFDYSWQLLSAEERRVFSQLTVFRGGFQREAAAQVVGASLPLLLALVDKSLLRRTETGRYTRHLLLWQYAAEKIDEMPLEKERLQDRHCDYYTTFLRARETLLTGGKQKGALAEISAEIENVRLCWRWAIAQGKIMAIEQALESLFHFYDMHSWFQEGAEAFGWAAVSLTGEERRGGEAAGRGLPARSARRGEQGSGVAEEQRGRGEGQNPRPSDGQSKIILGKLLARQGWFTFQLGQHGPAQSLLQESLALLRRAEVQPGARREMVFTLNYLGAVHRHLGKYEPAKQCLQESLAICQEVGDQFGLTIALNILSQVAYLEGDYPQARRLCQESLALKQKIGDRRGMTFSLNNLGQVAYTLGEYPEAKEFFQESLAICHEMGEWRGIALCLSYLGDVVQMMGEYQGAKQLYQESLAIFKEIGNQWGSIFSRTKLGFVACELGEYQAAKEYFSESLKKALDIQAMPAVLDALVGVASLLIRTGDAKRERALKILALALSHPASSRDNQDRAARLLAELEPQLPAGTVKAIQTRRQTSTLEMIAQEVLGEGRG